MTASYCGSSGFFRSLLKGNQGTLHDDVSLYLDDPVHEATPVARSVDADHGRIETRTALVSTDIGWLQESHHWPGLAAVGKVTRIREPRPRPPPRRPITCSVRPYPQSVSTTWSASIGALKAGCTGGSIS